VKKKYLIIHMLVIAFVISIAVSFAWWASGIDGDDFDTENIIIVGGAGRTVTELVVDRVATDINPAMSLVPIGFATIPTETDIVTFRFTVRWIPATGQNPSVFPNGRLTVTPTRIVSGGIDFVSAFADELFIVGFNGGGQGQNEYILTGGAAAINVWVTLRMNEPTMEQYAILAGQQIVISFNFSVEEID